jgi:hypothetical protein
MTHESKQTTLNEQIEKVTGHPVPENTVSIELPVPARHRTKPGFHSLFVYIPDAQFAQLESTADGRPINVWLSRLIERHFASFELK